MSKIRKESNKDRMKELEMEKNSLKVEMFKSSLITYLLAGLFLIISFIFNGRLISKWTDLVKNSLETVDTGFTFLSIIDIIIKSLSIILFFFFSFISLANWKEMRGYIMTWKEMLVLLIFSLIQGTIEGTVFIIAAFGVVLVLVYMYFIQGKIETRSED